MPPAIHMSFEAGFEVPHRPLACAPAPMGIGRLHAIKHHDQGADFRASWALHSSHAVAPFIGISPVTQYPNRWLPGDVGWESCSLRYGEEPGVPGVPTPCWSDGCQGGSDSLGCTSGSNTLGLVICGTIASGSAEWTVAPGLSSACPQSAQPRSLLYRAHGLGH